MNIQENIEHNFGLEISNDEREAIYEFLSSYRNQDVIVADELRQDFSMVPLEDEKIIFKINEDIWKSMRFTRKISYKEEDYIVNLGLWRVNHSKNDPKCLSIFEFDVTHNGIQHHINLDIKDCAKNRILLNILDIFDERKIISPEQAYCKIMKTNKVLQDFIFNHEWKKIDEGVNQMPSLSNALFIIKEGYQSSSHFKADFGTILYQLISYRMKNLDDFDKKDLDELDKLILKLSKTELLKVQLHEATGTTKGYPTSSLLLESINSSSRMHRSELYCVDNLKLLEEQKVLKDCIKSIRRY